MRNRRKFRIWSPHTIACFDSVLRTAILIYRIPWDHTRNLFFRKPNLASVYNLPTSIDPFFRLTPSSPRFSHTLRLRKFPAFPKFQLTTSRHYYKQETMLCTRAYSCLRWLVPPNLATLIENTRCRANTSALSRDGYFRKCCVCRGVPAIIVPNAYFFFQKVLSKVIGYLSFRFETEAFQSFDFHGLIPWKCVRLSLSPPTLSFSENSCEDLLQKPKVTR